MEGILSFPDRRVSAKGKTHFDPCIMILGFSISNPYAEPVEAYIIEDHI